MKWISKETNEPRSRVVIRARSMQMLGGKPTGDSQESNRSVAEPAAPVKQDAPKQETSPVDEVDDLPF